ncbi:hypothetical protein ACHAXS_002913 [Conticribra weissflogii]
MVEGPGATKNGRKVQTAVGKSLCVPTDLDCGNNPLRPPIAQELVGYTLIEAFTVGKELFLIFSESIGRDGTLNQTPRESALRLHFGMNGSLNTRKFNPIRGNDKMYGVAPWKRNKASTLRLYFANQNNHANNGSLDFLIIECWETNVSYPVSVSMARNKLTNNSSRDICSSLFNAQDAFTCLKERGRRMNISDALLDQEISPGVGNIIKIESLHRAKIDPRRAVSSLSEGELRRVVRHTRQFSMGWLKSGRAGEKLVYNQTVCGTCKGLTVKMQKFGGGSDVNKINGGDANIVGGGGAAYMSRVTFWCSSCQPMTTETRIHSHAPNLYESAHIKTTRQFNETAALSRVVAPKGCCPQHGEKSVKLRRARNSNYQNTSRIFFTCKYKDCQYFSWADAHFPNCSCGKKVTLRISKTERSGGRWFLCCPISDRSNMSHGSKGVFGCGHFEWASNDHLGPLCSLLTPLL